MNAIEFRDVTKRFPGVTALDSVTFAVKKGSIHSICGENGAGKSTLMKILSGVYVSDDGQILINGEPHLFATTRDAEQAGISIIHQELNLVEELSVAANIFLGREICKGLFLDNAAMESRARELFAQLACDIDPRTLVRELRVGDQQLVEIAKALSLKSEILIMDEPTSALTESEVDRLYRVIDRLQADGVTILYISHKMDEVFRLSNQITVLRDGQHVDTLDCEQTTPQQITHLMVGRQLAHVEVAKHRSVGETVLKVDRLSLPWPGHARQWKLNQISFELKRGEVLGVAGLMGAGRTELLECLFGANDVAIEGSIFLHGKPVHFDHPADAKDAGIAMVTEDRKRLGLFQQMDVRENISVCALPAYSTRALVSQKREHEAATQAIRELGIRTASDRTLITSLSGGNQQKCIIARWLDTEPEILLLDDPTRGVDVGAKAELYETIDRLCNDGLSILVTSSELPELMTLCDRILVLCEGKLAGELSRVNFSEERIMELATALAS